MRSAVWHKRLMPCWTGWKRHSAAEQRFTGDAAHELRTPLTALKGQLEVTLNHPRSVQSYQTTLQAMSEQVERLIHLSSSLLYLARLEQGQVQFSTETIMVEDFFRRRWTKDTAVNP